MPPLTLPVELLLERGPAQGDRGARQNALKATRKYGSRAVTATSVDDAIAPWRRRE
jgi:hypothetical protein